MDLRRQLAIVQRRRMLLSATILLALLLAFVSTAQSEGSYQATVRLAASLRNDGGAALGPETTAAYPYFQTYYGSLSSEYLADDLSEIVRSDAFLADVGTFLGEVVKRSSIREATRPRRTHRLLDITVQAADAEQTRRLASAIPLVLRMNGPQYLAQLANDSVTINVIAEAEPSLTSSVLSRFREGLLRAVLGCMLGLMLAGLVDHLDSVVRTAREAERSLGLPVLGEIPTM